VTENMANRMERGVTKANASVTTLDKSTGDLVKSASQAEVAQSKLGREIEKTGTSAGRAERSIDKYSGRLRVLTDRAARRARALRLGAGALPAITAGLPGSARPRARSASPY
jgi:peptidoglycan hydrolase CwlO-like protein